VSGEGHGLSTLVSTVEFILGVHFPSDVIFGAIYGISAGLLFYKLSLFFFKN
jgi:PAP2 superfamily.